MRNAATATFDELVKVAAKAAENAHKQARDANIKISALATDEYQRAVGDDPLESALTAYRKALDLARNANSNGDRVAAESYIKDAEHRYRIMAVQAEVRLRRLLQASEARLLDLQKVFHQQEEALRAPPQPRLDKSHRATGVTNIEPRPGKNPERT
jgi:hypothetical protein